MSQPELQAEGLKPMLRLAFPVIVINVSMTLMQFVDALMVSVLGDKPLAASLPAGLLFFVPIAFFMGVLAAVNTFVSQSLGRRQPERCGHYAWQGLYIGLIAGLGMLLLWFAAEGIFAVLDHEPEVQRLEVEYFRISLFGGLPILFGMALSNFFIGIHRTNVLAWLAVGATLLNIFFNWVFIFGNLGAPALGLAGAALGTVLAATAQTAGLFVVFLRKDLVLRHGTQPTAPAGKSIRELLRIGLPSGLQFGFDILSWGVALVWMVGLFGTDSLAATTIIVRCMHIGFMPPIALATVLVAMVGKSIGAGNLELANRQTRTAAHATLTYMGTVAVVFFLFRHSILGIFTESPAVIQLGAGVMILVAVFQIFDAMNIVYSHALRGAGDTFWQATVTAVLCLVVFVAGGVAVVHWLPGLGALGPWLMGTIYISLLGVAMAFRWLKGPWRTMQIFSRTGG